MGALTADEQLTNMCFDKTVQSAQQDFGQEHQQEAAPQQEGIGAALGNFAHRVLDVPVAALRVGGTLLRACSRSFNGKLIQGILTNGGIHEAPIPERR